MTVHPDAMVKPAADCLLSFLCGSLADLPNPPGRCGLRYGTQVIPDLGENENLCCEGLAWVRVASIYVAAGTETSRSGGFINTFPATAGGEVLITGCGIGAWGATLEMGVWRCAPVGDLNNGPSEDEYRDTFTQLMNDDRAMRNAIELFLATKDPSSVAVAAWIPLEVEGGCVGGTRTIQVQFDDCEECLNG